jgi:hypothetical protein
LVWPADFWHLPGGSINHFGLLLSPFVPPKLQSESGNPNICKPLMYLCLCMLPFSDTHPVSDLDGIVVSPMEYHFEPDHGSASAAL